MPQKWLHKSTYGLDTLYFFSLLTDFVLLVFDLRFLIRQLELVQLGHYFAVLSEGERYRIMDFSHQSSIY